MMIAKIPAIVMSGVLASASIPVAAAASANPWAFLPTRAIDTEAGTLTFQAGARCERDLKQFHMLFRRHPLQYFLVVTNADKTPIRVTAELQLPDEAPQKFEGTLQAGAHGTFFWKSSGLVSGQPIPLKISIHPDADRSRVLSQKDTTLLFPERDKEAFLGSIYDAMMKAQVSNERQCPVISGWQEMKDFSAAVPGSAADGTLQKDVKRLLWKEQSRANWECPHEIVKAEPLPSASAPFSVRWPDDLKRRIEEIQKEGGVAFEKWTIQSCDAVAAYEVMMMKSSKGGTNVLAQKVPPEPADR
jgi:hypothetical protein